MIKNEITFNVQFISFVLSLIEADLCRFKSMLDVRCKSHFSRIHIWRVVNTCNIKLKNFMKKCEKHTGINI